jgi:hypothetical protein
MFVECILSSRFEPESCNYTQPQKSEERAPHPDPHPIPDRNRGRRMGRGRNAQRLLSSCIKWERARPRRTRHASGGQPFSDSRVSDPSGEGACRNTRGRVVPAWTESFRLLYLEFGVWNQILRSVLWNWSPMFRFCPTRGQLQRDLRVYPCSYGRFCSLAPRLLIGLGMKNCILRTTVNARTKLST